MKHFGWTFLWVAVATAGAAPPQDRQGVAQDGPGLTSLQRAEAQWQARRPKAYEYTIDVRCLLCSAPTPPRFRVVNRATTLLDAVPSFTREVYLSFGTIEKLFAAIRATLARGQDKVAVQYNAVYGYPEVVDLDPRRDVFDEELYFRVIGFRIVD